MPNLDRLIASGQRHDVREGDLIVNGLGGRLLEWAFRLGIMRCYWRSPDRFWWWERVFPRSSMVNGMPQRVTH